MKKDEAERAIRSLCTTWAETLDSDAREHPSFYQFRDWLSASGYGMYMDFKSRMGAAYDAEMWFDDELGQSWRR